MDWLDRIGNLKAGALCGDRPFVQGGVRFIPDPSVSGYEWIDDRTVRIHPDSIREMLANLATA